MKTQNDVLPSTSEELLSKIQNLREFKAGLKISNTIRETLNLLGRKSRDTLQQWHKLGCVVEEIKAKVGKRYGSGLMSILEKEFGHDKSDLNRAAKFVRQSPDYEVFQEEHPEVSDLRRAVRTTVETHKAQTRKVPSARAIAKQLEKCEGRVNKIVDDFLVLLADKQDTSEVELGLARILDRLKQALGKRLPEIDALAQSDAVPLQEEEGDIDVVPYRKCSVVGTRITGPLADIPIDDIAAMVVEIAEVEGPIHEDDLLERVLTITKQPRAGKRTRDKIRAAIDLAASDREWVTASEGFIWSDPEKKIRKVRVRQNPKDLNLTHVCDEELRLAIEKTCLDNDTKDPGSTARAALNLLGFPKPRKADCDRMLRLLKTAQHDRGSARSS